MEFYLCSALANTGFSRGIVTAMQQPDSGNFQYVWCTGVVTAMQQDDGGNFQHVQ